MKHLQSSTWRTYLRAVNVLQRALHKNNSAPNFVGLFFFFLPTELLRTCVQLVRKFLKTLQQRCAKLIMALITDGYFFLPPPISRLYKFHRERVSRRSTYAPATNSRDGRRMFDTQNSGWILREFREIARD